MSFLLYGATGYTGALLAEAAVAQGLRPTLAGRSEAPLRALGERLSLPSVVVGLDDTSGLTRALEPHPCVVHCAGPFVRTSKAMVDACLQVGRHYLDITGEIAVFEALAARDAEARARGVMLLPGVGFDVVPSDCLLLHVKERLPSATTLRLCIASLGSLSHGTAATAVDGLDSGGAVRRAGKLARIRVGSLTRDFDFGDGTTRLGIALPWGDLATAYRSTGVGHIETYFALPAGMRIALTLGGLLGPVLGLGPVKRALARLIPAGGPDATARDRGRSTLVAEASDDSGHVVRARLQTRDGYSHTVDTTLLCVRRVLAGHAPVGFQTPAKAYGADLVLEAPQTTRVDLPA